MIKSKLMFCTENAVIDARTNNISVFNIFDEINVPRFPITLLRIVAVTILELESSDDYNSSYDCSLRLAIDDEILFEHPFTIDFKGKKRNRNIMTIEGLPLPQPGTLTATFHCGDQTLNHYEIAVNGPEPTATVQEEENNPG